MQRRAAQMSTLRTGEPFLAPKQKPPPMAKAETALLWFCYSLRKRAVYPELQKRRCVARREALRVHFLQAARAALRVLSGYVSIFSVEIPAFLILHTVVVK